MPTRWRRGAAGLAVALLLPLTGCGGGDYCGALEEQRKEIADMLASGSPSALLDGLPMLRDLAEQAPDDLTDEWETLIRALDGLDDAISKAGVKPGDFEDGKPPAGLSVTDQKAIADAAGQIGADEVVQASSGIEQQARDVCKINLGL
ncbi:MAG: hypothetical protein ABWX73_09455 [Marmoricola sp.]